MPAGLGRVGSSMAPKQSERCSSSIIEVQGRAVSILTGKDGDFISLTDMLKAKDGEFFISDWLRNRNTVEFLGIWESVFNPGFNYGEFAIIRSQLNPGQSRGFG